MTKVFFFNEIYSTHGYPPNIRHVIIVISVTYGVATTATPHSITITTTHYKKGQKKQKLKLAKHMVFIMPLSIDGLAPKVKEKFYQVNCTDKAR